MNLKKAAQTAPVAACRTIIALLFLACSAQGQQNVGEVRLRVLDPSGLPLRASGQLKPTTDASLRSFFTEAEGTSTIKAVSFGKYLLTLESPGFADLERPLEIKSAIPLSVIVRMRPRTQNEQLTVSAIPASLDVDPTTRDYTGTEALRSHQPEQAGRALLDQVASQPGWLMEANGVLHPRGSEYQTQWVVDGIPLTDNRSPGFASPMDPDALQSFTIWTSGYPAEYGRKLGGVIDAVSVRPGNGVHGDFSADGGSFGNTTESGTLTFARDKFAGGISSEYSRSDRYLDPPSPENFHNTAQSTDADGWFESDLSPKDRVRLGLSGSQVSLQVPNLPDQELASQTQDRHTDEVAARFGYQHVFSPQTLAELHLSWRDLNASLLSNGNSVPIAPQQSRGFNESYLSASTTAIRGHQEWKFGADMLLSSLHERFSYLITAPEQFHPGTPIRFSFLGSDRGTEVAGYLQDRVTLKNWSIQAGIRWDYYGLLVTDRAFSPRFAVMWHSEKYGMSAHASFDRVLQTPASENLLLSSSAAAQHLTDNSTGLPVQPSHGNFYEVGLTKTFHARVRFDVNWFSRRFDNFADDDVFLNTGISFPIAFKNATIQGTETKLIVPLWHRITASFNYTNMIGRASLPVTGGLLLEGADQLTAAGTIPITQDQRNTWNAALRYNLTPRIWMSTAQSYGSGLPFEEEVNAADVDPRILRKLDLERQRVRPFYSATVQAGWQIWNREEKQLTVQGQVANLFNSFQVINFAGAFSATALGPPRNVNVRLRYEF